MTPSASQLVPRLSGGRAVCRIRRLTSDASSRYGRLQPQLNALGIVTSDMARSITFYRLLGLDVPETPEEKDPWDAVWGQRYAQLRDPNGVPVSLYAPL